MSTLARSFAPVVVVAFAILVAACTGAGSGAPASPGPSTAAPTDPAAPTLTPVPVPGASGSADGGSGSGSGSTGGGSSGGSSGGSDAGGGTSGNPGTGGLMPIGPGAGGNPVQPVPSFVKPVAGLTGVHDVSATALHASVSGRHVAVQVAWWSGVEPCSVLAGVDVQRDGSTFTLTVREGSAAGPETMCIEIAMYKATIVDLGDLDPGTYEVRAPRDAAPLKIVVEG